MAIPVIVPLQSKALFDNLRGFEVDPFFYKLQSEPFLDKVRRKLKILKTRARSKEVFLIS